MFGSGQYLTRETLWSLDTISHGSRQDTSTEFSIIPKSL